MSDDDGGGVVVSMRRAESHYGYRDRLREREREKEKLAWREAGALSAWIALSSTSSSLSIYFLSDMGSTAEPTATHQRKAP